MIKLYSKLMISLLQIQLCILLQFLIWNSGRCQLQYINEDTSVWVSIDFALFNFGYVPYEESFISFGSTLSSNQDLCLDNSVSSVSTSLLIVDCGSCMPYKLALNAQALGVKQLVIINSADEDLSQLSFTDNIEGFHITLQALLINHAKGEVLKKYYSSQLEKDPNFQLVMKIDFPTITKKSQAKIEYWFTGIYHYTYIFFQSFAMVKQQLAENYIDFQVHLETYQSPLLNASSGAVKDSRCVSSGAYCMDDPDGSEVLTGKDQILQGLATICLKYYQPEYFLLYLIKLDQNCIKSSNPTNTSNFYVCQEELQDQIFEDPTKVQKQINQCINSTFEFGDYDTTDNIWLSEEKMLQIQNSVLQLPALYVNQKAIKGNVSDYDQILSAVCAGLANRDQIDACVNLANHNIPQKKFYRSISPEIGILIAILIVAFFIAIVFYRKYGSHNQTRVDTTKSDVVRNVQKYLELMKETE